MSLNPGAAKRPGTDKAYIAGWKQTSRRPMDMPQLFVSVGSKKAGDSSADTVLVTEAPGGGLNATAASGAPAVAVLKSVPASSPQSSVAFDFARKSRKPNTLMTSYNGALEDEELRKLLLEVGANNPPPTVNAAFAPAPAPRGAIAATLGAATKTVGTGAAALISAAEDTASAAVEGVAGLVRAPVSALFSPSNMSYAEPLARTDIDPGVDFSVDAFKPNGALSAFSHKASLDGNIIRPSSAERFKAALDNGGHIVYGDPVKITTNRVRFKGVSDTAEEFRVGYTAEEFMDIMTREVKRYGEKVYAGFVADTARHALVVGAKISVECIAGAHDGKWFDPPSLAIKAPRAGYYQPSAVYNTGGHLEAIRVPLAATGGIQSVNLSPYANRFTALAAVLKKRPHAHSIVEFLARNDVATATTSDNTEEKNVTTTSVTYRIPLSERATSSAVAAVFDAFSDERFNNIASKSARPFTATPLAATGDYATFEVKHRRAGTTRSAPMDVFRAELAYNIINFWDRVNTVGQNVFNYQDDEFKKIRPYPIRLVIAPPSAPEGGFKSNYCVYASAEVTVRFPVGVYAPA